MAKKKKKPVSKKKRRYTKLATYAALIFEAREMVKLQLPYQVISQHMQNAMTGEDLVASGGDSTSDRVTSDDPSQCVCGTDWNCETDEQILGNQPNQAAINAFMANIPWPTKSQTCKDPCIAVEQLKAEYWHVWKNTTTGMFRLFGSKRKQWHCEKIEDNPT